MITRLDDMTVFHKFKAECTLCCLILASCSVGDSVLYFVQQVMEIFRDRDIKIRYIHKIYIHIYTTIKYVHICNAVKNNSSQKRKYCSARSDIALNFSFPTKK